MMRKKGQTVLSFLQNKRCFRGPDFLWRHEDAWPSTDIGSLSSGDPELKDEKLMGMLVPASSIDQLLKRYFSWTVTQQKVAILMKFFCYQQLK